METRIVLLSKPGAVYSSDELAKNALYSNFPQELTQSILDNDADLLEIGILLEPTTWSWDQDTETLTITRKVVSQLDYMQNRTWTLAEAQKYLEQGGWKDTLVF
jgi:hypothetical protein